MIPTDISHEGIVCSVPHSGTRTLVQHLNGKLAQSPRGGWLHFDYDDGLLKKHKHLHLHIPIRDPMQVATSWARRDKNPDAMVRAYESMFNHLDRPHTLHKIEDIPGLGGTDDWPDKVAPAWMIKQYQDIVRQVIAKHTEIFKFYDIS